MKYSIRKMRREELDIAIEWAAKEGWNPGLYDGDAFYAADPNGFFIGLLDDIPISCISAVSYNENFGFLGFYIVKHEYRGKGYGLQIWKEALAYLKKHNIGLDGVVAQQENYKKSGFALAYRNIRYQGKSKKFTQLESDIIRLSQIPYEELITYDNTIFPSSRQQFLKSWIHLPESVSFGIRKNGKLVGYSVIRKCRNGYKIGPLFADNKEIAEQLFIAGNNFLAPETDFFLDTPETNSAAVDLAKRYNMHMCFETARMYTKGTPHVDLNKVFGVTTFELG